MKYLFQFCIIMIFVFLGELMEFFIPLPIAGSIYGLVLMFLALTAGIIKLEWVADVADWFHGVMALFFVAPAVAIIDIWSEISDVWPILLILLVVAYLVTMVSTGLTADAMIPDAPAPTTKTRRRRNPGGKK